jgi:hypothetical protein
METIIRMLPVLVIFILTAVAVLTDGFDFTLYREQLKKSKKQNIRR